MQGSLESLAQAQRALWSSWAQLVSGAALLRGQRGLVQRNLELLCHSAEVVLATQRVSGEMLAHAVPGSKVPTLDESRVVEPQLGATASLTKTVTDADITAFAQLSGDVNPVHLDQAYAEKTRFGGRIAHGMLSAGLISAVLGTRLPGPGAVYLSQSLKFLAPVKVGDEVTATATVIAQKEGKPIYTLATVCTNGRGERVLEGEAVILYDPLVP